MSKFPRDKGFTVAELKRRGWTNNLIRERLPLPKRFWLAGRMVRFWTKAEVQEAEKDLPIPIIQSEKTGRRQGRQAIETGSALLVEKLERSWKRAQETEETPKAAETPETAEATATPETTETTEAAEVSETAETAKAVETAKTADAVNLLAERIHRALLARIQSGTGVRHLRTAQAASDLGEFLSLEKRSAGNRTPELLSFFARAALWLQNNPALSLCVENGFPGRGGAVHRRAAGSGPDGVPEGGGFPQ